MRFNLLKVILLALLWIPLQACQGHDAENNSAVDNFDTFSSDTPSAESVDSSDLHERHLDLLDQYHDVLGEVLDLSRPGGMGQYLTKMFFQRLRCEEGYVRYSGHVDYQNDDESVGELRFEFRLIDCDGLTGKFQVSAFFDVTEEQKTYQVISEGDLKSDHCQINLDNLDTVFGEESFSYSGESSGKCFGRSSHLNH